MRAEQGGVGEGVVMDWGDQLYMQLAAMKSPIPLCRSAMKLR